MCSYRLILAILCFVSPWAVAADSGTSAQTATTKPDLRNGDAASVLLTGEIVDAAGTGIASATLKARQANAISDAAGKFGMVVPRGQYKLEVEAQGYEILSLAVSITSDTELTIHLRTSSSVMVSAKVDEHDFPTQVYRADELLTNSSLPGSPFSLPGLPSETASGGVKAPQYFAPGVAGDHGEPIAQYIRVGDALVQNNLPANAHGNGYADPNLLIPAAIGGVQTDAGAFDVRHGNHAVNLAVAYELRPRLEPVVEFSGDSHDYDFMTGWSPKDPATGAWLGMEVSGGNGFLALPENRKQYKINAERSFTLNRHQVAVFAAGYYGYSRIPGLVPIDVGVPSDTIDPRQADRTHTSLLVASDTWQLSDQRQVQFSGFFRTYSLNLKSDFGDGLIRQSEFRTVAGGNTSYSQDINRRLSFTVAVDLRQDAPRNAELARADASGSFSPVTLNNFRISDIAPYVSVRGALSHFLSYDLGARRDVIIFSNLDRLKPGNGYRAYSGISSPRGTLSLHMPMHMPVLSFSYGQAFHTNDPRMRIGTSRGTPIATSHAYQLVASEFVAGTQFRLSLNRTANAQELGKIDADTGLQQNVGPSLVRAATLSIRRPFSWGSMQTTFARASAIQRFTGLAVPEAPRLIWDVSGTILRLPARMRASGEFEYVGRKPLGDGFVAVPVRDIRGSLTRSFKGEAFEAGVQFLLAHGYTGQTLETLQLPRETEPTERIVGVRKASYAAVTFSYHLRAVRH